MSEREVSELKLQESQLWRIWTGSRKGGGREEDGTAKTRGAYCDTERKIYFDRERQRDREWVLMIGGGQRSKYKKGYVECMHVVCNM